MYMYMYMGWVGNDELATRLITVFGTAQEFRGAFGANPCDFYRMHTRYLIGLVRDHVNPAMRAVGKKILMIMWKRDWFCILLSILGGIGECIYVYIYSNNNNYEWLSIDTIWIVIISINAQRKELSNIEIIEVNICKGKRVKSIIL